MKAKILPVYFKPYKFILYFISNWSAEYKHDTFFFASQCSVWIGK